MFYIPRDPPAFGRIRLAVRKHLQNYGEIPAVGLSGGADSLALAAALAVENNNVQCTALIVDHQLQAGSAAVAQKAAQQAENMGLKAQILKVTVAGSHEAAAREARYAALTAAAPEIAIGHTRDDQAETYLLGALRGNPAGMLPAAHGIHRPLLELPRSDTRQACAELGLQWWEDPHNSNRRYQRVQVRQLLAGLAADAQDPESVIAAIATAAARTAADREAIRSWAAQLDARDIKQLEEVPAGVRREAIVNLITEIGGKVSGASVAAVEALITRWKGQGAVAIGNGYEVRRHGVRLIG
ncbi:tRNA lysidine(34) synthetase TilS [Corynebacterium caspium]|uniref:tRNA lysidine(34) synthetase TilS n=1 Tax=Corynebacterium caspium TaxID=234828 RepID=UPI0003744095|nr:tRNA lysidine(34) synthetase TilS [Corynebacterium caspium]WKD58689.1 tRNA(Ile)-lysidine synthase [Corynebacterium caspium DSM 44850]